MKKVLVGIAVCALGISTFSCAKKVDYSPEEKNLGDSISIIIGNVMGARVQNTVNQPVPDDPGQQRWNIDDIVKGIQSVVYGDTVNNYSYLLGQQIGLEMMQPLRMLGDDGIPTDPSLVVRAFKEAYYNDSISANEYMQQYQALYARVKEIKERKEAERREIESQENGLAGKNFIDSVKKADPQVQTTESGLSYKIENPGGERKVTPEDKVKINYKGSTINGVVFDQTNGTPREMRAGGFIPGFKEGLTLLGEGGKATLYIPGDIAYGDRGITAIGIGPNATLVFEVEVVEIIPEESNTK